MALTFPGTVMPSTSQISGEGSTVLILEDSASVITQITRALRIDFPRLRILCAQGLVEAQVLAAEYPVDIFLLDLAFPDSASLEFLSAIQNEHCDGKVILVSSALLPEHREQARTRGVGYFLKRPIDLKQLCVDLSRELESLPSAQIEAAQKQATSQRSY